MKYLTLLILCGIMVSCNKTRSISYIFNKGDDGWFVILYNVDNAQKIDTKNKKTEFDFTKSHILETSSSPILGSYKVDVLIVDDAGNRRILENNLYSLYPSRYVEEIIGGRHLTYQEFHFGKADGSGDARSLVKDHLGID